MNKIVVYALLFVAGYAVGWFQFSDTNTPKSSIATSEESLFEQFDKLHAQSGNSSATQQSQQVTQEQATQQMPSVSESLAKLRDLEALSYTDFASLALSPTVEKISEIIDDMSQTDLEIAISSITTFTQQEIENLHDTHAFAKKLIAVALSNGSQEKQENIQPIQFGIATNTDNQITEPFDVFESNTERIYASFSLPVGSQEKILVKWFRNAPYTLQIMNRYKINPNSQYNYVWFRPKNWESGLYTVEVFAMNSELLLLASGNFEIK